MSKKIVLVIVEGKTDDISLGVALSQVYDKDAVYLHIMRGDITTRNGVDASNVVSKVGNEIKSFAKSRNYKKSDFRAIIHIVDTDGAYIPNEKIVPGDVEGIRYEDDAIYTSVVEKIVERNLLKRENLSRLQNKDTIWEIPYRVFYMSCNLDHVLHNKRNSIAEEKEFDAYSFAKKYKDDKLGFSEFICKSDFSVMGNYVESWNFIERDVNSLKRYTNLGIALEEELGLAQKGE